MSLCDVGHSLEDRAHLKIFHTFLGLFKCLIASDDLGLAFLIKGMHLLWDCGTMTCSTFIFVFPAVAQASLKDVF